MKAQALAAPRSMAIDAVHHQPAAQQAVADAPATPPAETPKAPTQHKAEHPQDPKQEVHSTHKQKKDHGVAIAITMTIIVVVGLSALAVFAYLQDK